MALTLATAVGYAQDCRSEVEPNDSPAEATELEGARCLSGSLGSGDQDAYTLRVSEDEAFTRYQLRVAGPSSELTKIDVFRIAFVGDGPDVASADTLFTFGTSDGREAHSEPFLLAPGRYTVGVSSSGGGGGYEAALVTADDVGSVEGIGDGAVRDAFSVGVAGTDGDRSLDWTIEQNERLWRLDVHVALGARLDVALLRADGNLVAEGQATGSRSWTVSDLDLDAGSGSYRIVLRGSGAAANAIVVASAEGDATAPGEREPNDEPEQANELSADQATPGRLSVGDVDRFVFQVDATLATQLFDLRVDTEVDVAVTLSSDDGTVLQQRRGVGGALRSLHLPEGVYRLALVGHGDGPYELSFLPAGSPQSGVEQEPNDTTAAAYPLDDSLSVRGELGLQDVDTFRFEIGGDGGRFRVQVLARGAGVERVSVTDAQGATLAETTVAAGERRIRLDDVELPPGSYHLAVEGASTEYAVRMLDLGELAARPPDLEAEQEGSDETLTVETVNEPPADADPASDPPAADEAPRDEDTARTAPETDPCGAGLASAPPTVGEPSTYRYAGSDAFACGEAVSAVTGDGGVRIDDEPAGFRFIWVSASLRGTVIKIDTDTGEILGEYWTAPVYDPLAPSMSPSRSVVDGNGNAWIGNRDDRHENMGSVVQIGLLENGQCVDRNGDGTIQTSQGLGDVLPWNNENDADRTGGVSTAGDECVLAYTRVSSTGVRHLSVAADAGVWVSGTGGRIYDLLDGDTGEIVRTEPDYACGGYGGLIDREGVLWSARSLLRWDPDEPLARESVLCDHNWTYGLGLGPDDRVWASDFDTSVCRLTREGEVDVCHDAEDSPSAEGVRLGSARGVAVTDDGDVWVAFTTGSRVGRFDPDDGLVALVPVGGGPTGVSIDARGKVWVTNRSGNSAMRIDPASDEVDLTVELGGRGDPDETPFYDAAQPYTYSDMTGQLVFDPPEIGTWTATLRGPTFRTEWRELRYDAEVPDGAEIVVRVSASDGDPRSGARQVAPGEALDAVAANLVVSVTLRRAPDGASPVLRRLEIDAVPLPLAPGSVEVQARPDLVAASNAIGVILDASGSMGQLLPEGASRMEAARSVLVDLATSAFPAGVPLSLRVFGHLEPSTCHMRLELPLAPFEPEPFVQAVRSFAPKLLSGTPLADALTATGEDLAGAGGRKMVVLVTDGEESCGGDPEAVIEALAGQGIETVNIVGFALEDEAVKDRMRTWASLGGGRYLDAGSGDELARALNEILQPEFLLRDPFGEEVARGRVNLGPIEVPSGVYHLEVLSTPRKRIDGVRVIERDVSLTVRLQEEAAP